MPDKKPPTASEEPARGKLEKVPTWRGVEIKPCPFKKCGERYDLDVLNFSRLEFPWRVTCYNCHGMGSEASTGIAAVRAWNEVERRKG